MHDTLNTLYTLRLLILVELILCVSTLTAEVVDTYIPVVGDVCNNPEYYCDTACGPGCTNNCVRCNGSLFNTDFYWDSQSYLGRNCSITTCESGMEWVTEFSMHLYSLAEAGVFGLIEIAQDLPGCIKKISSGDCTSDQVDPPPPPPPVSAYTPVAPTTSTSAPPPTMV